MSKTAIVKCTAYDLNELFGALKTAANAAGIPDVKNKKVLLKPNILMDAAPEKAVTTNPVFLEAIIRLVKELGASRILVGDSPGLQTPNFKPRLCGIDDVVRKNGAELVDFTSSKTEIKCPRGKVQRRFTISGFYDEADIIINLPKIKTHQLMYFSGAMKNLFGLVPSIAKSPYHVRYPSLAAFAAMIVDLNLAMGKPVYTFMDAVIGMEGPGPASGTPRQVGLVIASSNSLAIDITACRIIGYPVEKIPSIRDALSRSHWLKDVSEIEYPLVKPEEVLVKDFVKIPFRKSGNQLIDFIVPKPIRKLFQSGSSIPIIDQKTCILCGNCKQICASGAINVSAEEPRIMELNKKNCICCYCCHEICPVKAIAV